MQSVFGTKKGRQVFDLNEKVDPIEVERVHKLFHDFVEQMDSKKGISVVEDFCNFCEGKQLAYDDTITLSLILGEYLRDFYQWNTSSKLGFYS